MITVLAVVCGVLFAVSLGIWKRVTQDTVEWYEDPFTYFALACVAVGAPLLLLVRALAGLVYERTINMFLTTLLAVAGALVLRDLFAAATIVFFLRDINDERTERACRALCQPPPPTHTSHTRTPPLDGRREHTHEHSTV